MAECFLNRAEKSVDYAILAGILLATCTVGYRVYDAHYGRRLDLMPEVKQSAS
jgi:hypothetical protein